jgi:hypothetical protein
MLAGALMLSGCSGNNPATPGSVNPPLGAPASTNTPESAAARQAAEKVTVHGSVADSRTGDAIPKATILMQALPEAPSAAPLDAATGSSMPPAEASAATGSDPAAAPASASAPQPKPAAAAAAKNPEKPIKLGVDDKGQFEVKDLLPGQYQITAFAPGYQPVTTIGVRPAQLHFELTPLSPKSGHAMTGTVKTAADKPASGARVVAGFTPGKTLGDAMTVGGDGKFDFKDLRSGKLPVAAYLAEGAEITAWAIQREVPIALGKEKLTPSPTLTLRAVTSPLILSGKVTSPSKELKPRQVHALLVEGDAEIPLITRTPDKDGFFRFSLPPLEEGQTYHLVATGLDEAGNTAYSHLHKVGDSDLKLELALPELPAKPEFQSQELAFGAHWRGSANASVYRLRVESVGDDAQTLWEGWTSGTVLAMPDPETLPILKKGQTYRASFSAVKVAEGTPYELTSVPSAPWASAASLAPITFKAGKPLDEDDEDVPAMGEKKPAASEAQQQPKAEAKQQPKAEAKPKADVKPKAEAKPQAKPAPAKPKGQVL